MTKFSSNYQQFCIDLPRLSLFIDKKRCKQGPRFVKNYFFEKFDSVTAKICIFLLTQTFLADFYISEYRNLVDNRTEHLLDDGDYIVWVNSKEKTINLQKNFKKVYLDPEEVEEFVLDLASLHICLDLDSMLLTYSWVYDIQLSDAPIMIEQIDVNPWFNQD